jgi:hypothetical protein
LNIEILGLFNAFNRFNLFISGLLFSVLSLGLIIKNKIKIEIPKLTLFSIFPILFAILVTLWNFIVPLNEIDSLAYHLPIMANIVRTGGIWDVFHSGFVGPNTFFPANHEAIQAFFYLLTGNIYFNFLVTLFGFFLFYFTLRDLFRFEKFSSWVAFFSILVISSVPFLFMQFQNFQVDLFVLFLLGAAISVLFSAIRDNNIKELYKFSAIIGILLGTKYTALPQILILLPIVFAAGYLLRKYWRHFFIITAIIMLLGGIWYIRNWIVAGNPIYPFNLHVGIINFEGHKALADSMQNTSILSYLNSGNIKDLIVYIFHYQGFSTLIGNASLLFIPFILLVLTFLLFKKKYLFCSVFLYLILTESIYYFSSPYSYTLWDQTIRYSSPIFAIIPVLFFTVAHHSKTAKYLVLGFSITVFCLNMVFYNFLAKESVQNLFAQKIRIEDFSKYSDLDDSFINLDYNFLEKFDFLKILRTRKNIEENQKIALIGITDYFTYDLNGYEPIYVNIDGCIECKYSFYKNEDKSVRAFPNKEQWKLALKKLDVKYLFINESFVCANMISLNEAAWAREDGEMFDLILKKGPLSLFRIL